MKSYGNTAFDMNLVNDVINMNLEDAKKMLEDVIKQSTTMKQQTKVRAVYDVKSARTTKKLAMTMTNWILAHPKEGLKVIK